MREVAHWALPGFVLAGPLHLFLLRCHVPVPVPLWLVAAPVLGFVLVQGVRWRFEARDGGFRNPRRAALQLIIERGNLTARPDAGDVAYQVYEVVFYQRPDWQAIRDHGHRCREHTFLCWSVTAACVAGAVLSLLGMGASPALALLYVVALPPAAYVLWAKGRQTLDAFELFDRGVVLAHWPFYAGVLGGLTQKAGVASTPATPER